MAEELGLEWYGAVEVSTGLCGGALVSIERSGTGLSTHTVQYHHWGQLIAPESMERADRGVGPNGAR